MASKDLAKLYEKDFFAWTERNAELLRAGKIQESDLDRIAREIHALGADDLKEMRRRARVILTRILICSIEHGKRAVLVSLATQRFALGGLLKQSPSLRDQLAAELPHLYLGALRSVSAKVPAWRSRLAAKCPFTVDQLLDPDFLPQLQ